PATAALPNLVHGDSETIAGRHAASHHRGAVRAHYHTVIRPPGGGQIERACAHMSLQLSGPAEVRKAERFRVDRPTPNENGQATPGPAVLVESGVHVDHQALPQTAFPPEKRFRKSLTRCWALVPSNPQMWGQWSLLIGWRQLRPHRVVAPIDVQELPRRHVQIVGEEHADGTPDGRFVPLVPAK